MGFGEQGLAIGTNKQKVCRSYTSRTVYTRLAIAVAARVMLPTGFRDEGSEVAEGRDDTQKIDHDKPSLLQTPTPTTQRRNPKP